MARIGIWLAAAIALMSAAASARTDESFQFEAAPGPYPVGLEIVEQYDHSRTYRRPTDEFGRPWAGERARPLQTLIWYPAERVSSSPMTVGDYARLSVHETSFETAKTSNDAREWMSEMSTALTQPLRASRSAQPRGGRFPVVIYAPSFSSSSWENADLCEYLASFGYLVVASPSFGAVTRKMTGDVAGIEAQARDISFLIGYAGTLPNADVREVAVVGFSWGGMSNLFAATRDSRIDALVALDGSLRYYPGLVREAGYVHPEQMKIPLLYFASQLTIEDLARFGALAGADAPSVLNGWAHGDLLMVRMLGLVHSEFSSMFQRRDDEWAEFDSRQHGDYGRKDGAVGYAWVAQYSLKFLDAYLKHDEASMAFLNRAAAQNGVPAHVMGIAYHAAAGLAPSFDAIRAEIGRRGFERAEEVYAALKNDNPTFEFEEIPADAWAEELIDNERWTEAISLLELIAKVHPASSATYADLGEAYRRSGQRSAAIDSFKKALERDADNEAASRALKELLGSRE